MIKGLRIRVWKWLPTFLEIAECGSVVGASRKLHLTPAAVSRTLGLLEEELGEELFDRVGRSLVLNAHGRDLQEALQGAVGRVDRALASTRRDPYQMPLVVSSLGVLTEMLVVPCLIEMKAEHPGFYPEHQNLGTAEAIESLARHTLDLAFYYEEYESKEVTVQRLGETPTSVYCGKDHPLYAAKGVSREALLDHAFSVPQVGDNALAMDGWPTEVPRTIGMQITTLRSNLQVCLSGVLLTVLPDILAKPYLQQGELRKLSAIKLPSVEIFAARALQGSENSACDELLSAVAQRLRECNQSLGS